MKLPIHVVLYRLLRIRIYHRRRAIAPPIADIGQHDSSITKTWVELDFVPLLHHFINERRSIGPESVKASYIFPTTVVAVHIERQIWHTEISQIADPFTNLREWLRIPVRVIVVIPVEPFYFRQRLHILAILHTHSNDV